MSTDTLPEGFGELERYVAWALPTERERIAMRETSPMQATVAFHDAMHARLEDVVEYLGGFAYPDLPDDARRLHDMALSLVEVSGLVEMYKDPAVLNMVGSDRFVSYE